MAQPLETGFRDQVIVFEPHSADTVDIEAGFEGHDIAGQQRVVTLRCENRRLGMS